MMTEKLEFRPLQFRIELDAAESRVLHDMWVRGPRGIAGGYRYPATRKRVRALSRQMARLKMKADRAAALLGFKVAAK